MKRIFLTVIIIFSCFQLGYCTEKLTDIVHFASVPKAQELLSEEDDFTKSWSPIDIDVRMQKGNSTKEELMKYIPTQALKWDENERKLLYSILEKYDAEIARQGYQLNFPDSIYFVKTTMDEEFSGAYGYTRSNNVMLNGSKVEASDENLAHVIMHELFHILSRHDPEFRAKMYSIIGFNIVDQIELPEELKVRKIANPDAFYTDSYIELKHNEQPVDCAMILYADKSYTTGNLMEYVNIGFVKLEGGKKKNIVIDNGKSVIYSMEQVTGFFEQVGKNTKYIIDPEEIMADNFTYTLTNKQDLTNPEIIAKIKEVLK